MTIFKINIIFIFIILLILVFLFLCNFFYITDNFFYITDSFINNGIDINNNLSKYRLIVVKNKNYILLHFKNIVNNENKIYKIYKNKFIL